MSIIVEAITVFSITISKTISDSGYNDFKRLYAIESIGAYFMDRGEENYDLRSVKWKRRILSGSGILSDAISYMDGQLIWESIPTRSGE